jgi:hypothetical protein
MSCFSIIIIFLHYKKILHLENCTTFNIIISLYFKGNNLILRKANLEFRREIKQCKM